MLGRRIEGREFSLKGSGLRAPGIGLEVYSLVARAMRLRHPFRFRV